MGGEALLGVLAPSPPPGAGPLTPPEALPLGRAALALAERGVQVVFVAQTGDGRASGLIAAPGGWLGVDDVAVAAVYDRFPSASRAEAHAALLAGLPGVPVANCARTVALCRDKRAAQRALEALAVPVPTFEPDPARFADRLAAWGAAFHKPRFGSFGVGVRRVLPGDPVPAEVVGAEGVSEPAILQRAVPAPAGWAGVCARVLVQRDVDRGGRFVAVTPVVRRSRVDPVANAARGAEVVPFDVAYPDPAHRVAVEAAALAAAEAVAANSALTVELGVDVVVDDDGTAWVIEVNGRPRGRLEALAGPAPARWRDAHVAACVRPLRYLAERFLRG